MSRELTIARDALANHYAGRLEVYRRGNELFWRNVRTSHITGSFGLFANSEGRLCFGGDAERCDIRIAANAIRDAEYF